MYVYGQDGLIHPNIIGLLLVVNNSNMVLQWGVSHTTAAGINIILPIVYNNYYNILLTTINSHSAHVSASYENDDGGVKTLSTFRLGFSAFSGGSHSGAYWFTIGY